MQPDKNTFCSTPFRELYTENDGSFIHCCHAVDTESVRFFENSVKDSQGTVFNVDTVKDLDSVWNSEFYKTLRQDLIQGVQNPLCKHCWRLEAMGAESPRDSSPFKDLDLVLDSDYTVTSGPEFVDLKTGNTCNLKCIMCHPANSSLHLEEVQELRHTGETVPSAVAVSHKEETNMRKQIPLDFLLNNLDHDLKNLKEIQLHGGEPLVTKKALEFIDNLIAKGHSKQIKVRVITNLAVCSTEIFHKLEQFQSVELIVSWDHVNPKKNSFIRYPINHARFLETFDYVRKNHSFDIKISNTLSVFNILDIEEIYDHFEALSQDQALAVTTNIVQAPSYFNSQYLSQSLKRKICDRMPRWLEQNLEYKIFRTGNCFSVLSGIPNFVSYQPSDTDQILKEQEKVLAVYDKKRGTNSQELFHFLFV
jgi:MoaA/NifB/PqqE/SkfB family radical SAM enzyme